jgi:hypothetical protein
MRRKTILIAVATVLALGAANLLTRDESRRIPASIAKFPDLLRRPQY